MAKRKEEQTGILFEENQGGGETKGKGLRGQISKTNTGL